MAASLKESTAEARGIASWPPRLLATLAVAGLVALGAVAAKPPNSFTIGTGPVGGSYHQNALRYKEILAAEGITLNLRPVPNTLDIIHYVEDSKNDVDAGFIAQDVSEERHHSVVLLGQIELQPLFIFASAELGRRSTIDELRGRRIVMPPADSATSAAAVKLFKLYDITPENSQFTFIPLADAAAALRAGKFDAGAFMLAAENPVVRELMSDSGLRLLPISEVGAIANHLPFLRPVLLPRGIYSIADAIPPNNTPMVAAPVGLVIDAGIHSHIVYSLLDAMSKVHRGATFLSRAGEFPSAQGGQLPVDERAEEYFRTGVPWIYRRLPAWPASFIEMYQVPIVFALLAAAAYVLIRILGDALGAAWEALVPRRRMAPQPAVRLAAETPRPEPAPGIQRGAKPTEATGTLDG
jgi:TRAP-type uncharacterized transport system substrate-binding protein